MVTEPVARCAQSGQRRGLSPKPRSQASRIQRRCKRWLGSS